ncbi:hypothetical protein TraAM80_00641 [Trypanosoma rangeli]|uniref:Uncharacterized protein n=1 Tax=Trypanosoma rangeli TaxID=5698 RepID=A0A3R7RSE6_TRYRA|nr:uncharacterized protein TraAM80_00641 [Trypanosoma rangeli]RNF11946.1 hypothetical protein TraAM80_00641 [Trypanosoma rangeli]|eukprot:RNF11946.1 hypothetical protein TraAM80_00641 [Trypanosoma rangeli]
MMERFVDSFTTVTVKMHSDINATAEQVPAPHAWHPEQDERVREEEKEKRGLRRIRIRATNSGRLSGVCNVGCYSEVAGFRSLGGGRKCLLTAQDMQARPSNDDRLAGRKARSSCRSLLQSPFASWVCRKRLSSVSSSAWSVNGACRSALSFPLAIDHEEDERYHHNFIRGEGCPLDENGRFAFVPIHIFVSPAANLLALERYCVMAHAAVLSSLFVEGRTVCCTTNHSLLKDYVTFLFEELVEDGWVSVSLCEESHRPYVPSWAINEGVLVVLPPREGKSFSQRDLRNMAGMIHQYAPGSVLVDAFPCGQISHYIKALKEEDIKGAGICCHFRNGGSVACIMAYCSTIHDL